MGTERNALTLALPFVSRQEHRRGQSSLFCRLLFILPFSFVLAVETAFGATLTLVPGTISVGEDEGAVAFEYRLTAGAGDSGNCSVTGITRTTGTATGGEDFSAMEIFNINGAIVAAGDILFDTVNIDILDDALGEPTETINITAAITSVNCDFTVVNAASATLIIEDDDPSEAPLTADDKITTQAGTPVTIDVLENDQIFGGLEVTIIGVTTPANGNAVINGDSITYIPNPGFVGSDSFVYTISDGITQANATVTVLVGPGVAGGEDQTETQMSAAEAVEEVCTTTQSPSLRAQCVKLARLNPNQVAGALQQIAPDEIAAQGTQAVEHGSTQLTNVLARLLSLRSGARGLVEVSDLSLNINTEHLPLGEFFGSTIKRGDTGGGASSDELATPSKLGIFINGRIGFGDKDTTEREAGFDFDTQGITFGVDYLLSPDTVLGGALGLGSSDADFDFDGGIVETDSFVASVYGSFYVPESMFLDAVISLGDNDYETKRNIRFPGVNTQTQGTTGGDIFAFSVNAGMEKVIGETLLVSPRLRLEFVNVSIDAYEETGGSGLALAIDEQSVDSATLAIGAEVSRDFNQPWGAFIPSAHIELENQLKDDARELNVRFLEAPDVPFIVPTDEPDKNYFNIGFGFTATIGDNIGAYVSVETVLAHDNISNTTVDAGVRIEF
ncbi:MAG: autotransporter domain-containing protein [Gammaproteobacteria bacterium]|nr:autotransporter domain-containing protein [Gammaproteobacteria bacterium]